MNKVFNILSRKNREPISVPPECSVLKALEIMNGENIGSLVIKENDKYLGIFSERDYSRKVVLKGKNSTETTVGEIMSTDLPVVSPSDTIDHCMELMSDKNIRYMPVFDGNRMVGIISMSDVVKETILAQKETIEHLQSYIQS
ncbi:MAG: CBS domain-containing protein [Bacteroidetes bacterium]|nr:MAG: CBS domain-containing protein [Bacteroidota bacterium]